MIGDAMRSDAEEMLDAITDRAALKLDREGKIVRLGAAARAFLGYSDGEVLGKHVSVFHAEDDRNAGLAERELAGARDSERVHFEGWRVCKDGRHFRAAVTITTLPVVPLASSVSGWRRPMVTR